MKTREFFVLLMMGITLCIDSQTLPNDPLLSVQAPYLSYINVYNTNAQQSGAWAVTRGNPNVIVAVLGDGINIHHEDLSDNIWSNGGSH